MLQTHTSQLQTIETIDDLEQFAPAATATEEQIHDFIDLHCALEDAAPSRALKVTPTTTSRAVALVLQAQDKPETVLSCPIDHTGNSKIESTPEQSWMIFSPTHNPSNFAIAFNNSGAYLIEPIK